MGRGFLIYESCFAIHRTSAPRARRLSLLQERSRAQQLLPDVLAALSAWPTHPQRFALGVALPYRDKSRNPSRIPDTSHENPRLPGTSQCYTSCCGLNPFELKRTEPDDRLCPLGYLRRPARHRPGFLQTNKIKNGSQPAIIPSKGAKKIRELLTDESKWTKWTSARNKFDRATRPQDPDAICWCLVGAFNKCYPGYNLERESVSEKLSDAVFSRFHKFINQWNDDPARTFAEVKALVEELDV